MVFLIMMFGIYIYNKSGLFVAKHRPCYHELQSAISIYNSLLTDAGVAPCTRPSWRGSLYLEPTPFFDLMVAFLPKL